MALRPPLSLVNKNKDPITHLAELRTKGAACAMVTVIATAGSTPRKAGAKMVVVPDSGKPVGTIGGGKLEALAIEMAQKSILEEKFTPFVTNYPLHEADEHSFGAVCGGEVTILTETFPAARPLVIVGAGHCGSAIARLARTIGLPVHLVDDRSHLTAATGLDNLPTAASLAELGFSAAPSCSPPAMPLAVVAVSRNYETDLSALRTIAEYLDQIPYVGMIGSTRKVRKVMDTLAGDGIPPERLKMIFAPIGLDIGAESPAEIAVSVIAQILTVTRGRNGGHLRDI